MKQRLYRVGGDVPVAVRAQLQALHPPRFPNIHLLNLTWADRVSDSESYESHWQDCTLYALHTGPTTQAFLANLAGERHAPSGRFLFVSYCTADGLGPWEARHIDPNQVEMLDRPITFGISLQLRPMWKSHAQSSDAAA